MASSLPPEDSPADALKIFISYSRRDMAAADAMVEALEKNGFSVTIDRRDLPYGEEWQKELSEFIAKSDTVVWLVSQDSIASRWCNWELGEVGRLSKRLVPVRLRDIDPANLPAALGKLHLLPAEGVYDATRHEAELVRTLNADRAWLKKATSLGEDAREWTAGGRDGARLLRGAALSEAETWSVRAPRDAPAPASEVLELIVASRRAQRRRQRMAVVGSIAAALVASGLAVTAFLFQQRAERQRDASLRNESTSLAALSGVARLEERPVDAVNLALAAWPRRADAERPPLRRTVEALTAVFPDFHERLRLRDHFINSAAFSPDGTRIVTASGMVGMPQLGNWTARVWDAATGDPLLTLRGHTGAVLSATYSADGTRILTASADGTARVWDATKEGDPLLTLPHPGDGVVSAAFSDKGDRIVTASGKVALIWDAVRGGPPLQTLAGHDDFLTSAAFSSDGGRVVTASDDATARIWDAVHGGPPMLTLRGHRFPVHAAAFSPDGTRIVTASADGTACVWNATREGDPLLTLTHGDTVTSAAFSPDGSYVVTGEFGGNARVWDTVRMSSVPLLTLSGHRDRINSAAFSSDGARIATSSDDRTARVWDVAALSKRMLLTLEHDDSVASAAFSPDGRRVVTASGLLARVWDSEGPSGSPVPLEHDMPVNSAAFSRDGARIVTAAGNAAHVWGALKGESHSATFEHDELVTSAGFSPDGNRVVTAAGRAAYVWDTANPRGPPLALAGHLSRIASATFSPDGTRIVTASEDGTALVWDAAKGGIPLLSLLHREEQVRSAAYSPDGTRIVTASNIVARVFDSASGELLLTINELSPWMADFSPDGTRILTTSQGMLVSRATENPVRIWDALTGVQLMTLTGHSEPAGSAAFASDGKRVVTASWDKTARIWDISSLGKGDLFAVACRRLGNNTSLKDVGERYGLSGLMPICGDNPPVPVDWSKLQ